MDVHDEGTRAMKDMWLIWCGNASYRQIREEIKERYGARRIIRLRDVDHAAALVDGLCGDRICAAVGMDVGAGDPLRAERMVRAFARADCIVEVIACMQNLDAGVAARCFDAGATEVIAVGDVATSDDIDVGACMAEGGHGPGDECNHLGYDAPTCDEGGASPNMEAYDLPDVLEVPWDELPPWDECVDEWADETEDGSPGAQRSESFENNGARWDGGEVDEGKRAPMVTVVSGRGGVGKTALVTAMAAYAAQIGLRAAVLDLDLMFGNAWEFMGAEGFMGIEGVGLHADERGLAERDIEGAAMRISPGLTLWGPCDVPEQAELCSGPIELLVDALYGVADVIFVDTSCHWGDAVAMAVSRCDRCLIVGAPRAPSTSSELRVIALASRLGVPHTRMTSVFNRFSMRNGGEEQALAFEMGTALHSRVRIEDGGDEVSSMLSFGQVNKLMEGSSPFAKSVRACTASLLQELGCPVAQWLLDEERRRLSEDDNHRLHLPWKRKASDAL